MLMTLEGLRTIRAYGLEEAHQRRFIRSSAEARQASMALTRLSSLLSPLTEVGYLAILCLIIAGSSLWNANFATTLAAVALLYRLQPHLPGDRRQPSLYGANRTTIALDPHDAAKRRQGVSRARASAYAVAARKHSLRSCDLPVSDWIQAGLEGCLVRDSSRPDHGARRPQRRRQDDDYQLAAAPLPAVFGHDLDR